MARIIVYLNFLRLIIPSICYLLLKKTIKSDLNVMKSDLPKGKVSYYSFCFSLVYNKAFRAVFLFRCSKYKFLKFCCSILFPNRREIEIGGNIGDGFAIYHGQGTVVYFQSTGNNIIVRQNVTIGGNPSHQINGSDCPIFGSNINVYAGAIVVGGIVIGNNVDIGAGCVVTKSVPANCVVVGNPAHIIYKNGKKVYEKL